MVLSSDGGDGPGTSAASSVLSHRWRAWTCAAEAVGAACGVVLSMMDVSVETGQDLLWPWLLDLYIILRARQDALQRREERGGAAASEAGTHRHTKALAAGWF